MSIISTAVLSGRELLRISGEDAAKFMQGLVTADVREAANGNAVHAALLNPQGKILFDFFIIRVDDGLLLDIAASQSDDLVKRLGMYKLRSKVKITQMPELGVGVCWPGDCKPDAAISFRDPRIAALGMRFIAPRDRLSAIIAACGARLVDESEYNLHRLQLGIAEGGQDFGPGEVFPHEANFDRLNGVSFTKGCYIGQEVVSRMRHKSQIRKRFLPVRISEGAVHRGDVVMADGKKAGIMGSHCGASGMALLRFDRIANASEITCNDALLAVIRPDWADFAENPGEGP